MDGKRRMYLHCGTFGCVVHGNEGPCLHVGALSHTSWVVLGRSDSKKRRKKEQRRAYLHHVSMCCLQRCGGSLDAISWICLHFHALGSRENKKKRKRERHTCIVCPCSICAKGRGA